MTKIFVNLYLTLEKHQRKLIFTDERWPCPVSICPTKSDKV